MTTYEAIANMSCHERKLPEKDEKTEFKLTNDEQTKESDNLMDYRKNHKLL